MLRPFLVLGLGGSGGKTLQVLKDGLLLQLRQAGWTSDDLPLAWQLLQIDVPPVSGEFHADLPDPLKGDQYLGLATPGVTYEAVDKSFTERTNANQLAREAAAGWKPRAEFVTVPIERGAGQFRAIGRMLTTFHLASINRAIQAAITRMQGLDAVAELQHVARLLAEDDAGASKSPVAVVVSSIAGGTGAGMFMDVCDVLRMTGDTWCDESVAILYTPDVFDELREQARTGVRPNALGSLSEILAGFWDVDGFSEDEQAMLSLFAGLTPQEGISRIGPRFPFLVGRSNGSVVFEHQNDSYRSMGRALSAWMTSAKVQTQMDSYVSGNWPTSTGLADVMPFKAPGQEQPFESMGFARVGLGRDRFQQYAAERLARSAIDRLLAGHMENLDIDDHRSSDQVRQDLVERVQAEFIAASGLDYTLDQVRQSVLDDEGFKRLHNGVVDELIKSVFDADHTLSAEVVEQRGRDSMGSFEKLWEQRYRAHYEQQLRAWSEQAQGRFVDFALQQSSLRGIPVTEDLIRRLSDRIVNKGVVQRIREGADAMRVQVGSVGVLDTAVNKTVSPDSPEARQIVSESANRFTRRMYSEALYAFADLLLDFQRNVIVPAGDALRAAQTDLKYRATDKRARSWPQRNDRNVPDRHRPTPNERVLLSHTDFDAAMKGLLRQQFEQGRRQGSIDDETAIDRAVWALVTQQEPGVPSVRELLEKGRKWVPENPVARPDANAMTSGPLSITIDLRPDLLRHRAQLLLTEPQTPIGRFMSMTMAEYFSDQVKADYLAPRLQALRAELAEALRAASPMVSISPRALNAVHAMPRMDEVRVFSGIPFPKGSQAHAVAEDVLTAFGMDEAARSAAFDTSAAANAHLDIFTVLATPVEAAVVDSLTEPIKSEWDKAAATGERAMEDFWRFRRTRPLPQAVPMAPTVRAAMVRGWFTAMVLGQIIDELDPTSGQGTLAVFGPGFGQVDGEFLRFSTPLLISPRAGRGDRVAGVLKSAVLAMLEANAGNMEPTKAYARLRQLGESGTRDIRTYSSLNIELRNWIENATVPAGAPLPPEKWAGPVDGSWDQRKKALATQFRKLSDNYNAKVFGPVAKLAHLDEAPRAWELRRDYLGALESLAVAVETFEVDFDVDL